MQLKRYQQIFLYEDRHWWYRGRRTLLSEILEKSNPKKILDFGCGPGSIMKLLNKFGEVSGVDIEPQAITYCQSKKIKNVKLIHAEKQLPFDKNTFDIVTCMDVLEHIADESKTLKDLYRVLKKNGLLIITVPAFSFLWGALDIHSHHVKRYNQTQLFKTLIQSGFTVEKIFYFNYFFFLPIVLIRLFQKSFLGKRNMWGVDPIIKNNFINNILTVLFEIDVKTALKLKPPFGVSLL